MSTLSAVRCQGCGGAVANVPGKPLPSCVFCGAPATDLIPMEPAEGVEDPVGLIPFVIDGTSANKIFQKFAKSSFWYPSDLGSSELKLRRVLVPSWAWDATVQTHWAGLISAHSASGKAPMAGCSTQFFKQVLVPASQTLTQAELASLGGFNEAKLEPFEPDQTEIPYEVSEVTRSVARQRAQTQMEKRHAQVIRKENQLLNCNVSSLVEDLNGRPVLVPVFIGAYRYGSISYRVLVNGETGVFVGKAPTSKWKVLGVTLAVAALVGIVFSAIFGCGGCLSIIGLAR